MNPVFISGEKINLCVPQSSDFEHWAGWFNSQEKTRYLEQGKYPNTTQQQEAFYHSEVAKGRFITLIKTKHGKLLGVISLSEINFERSSAQIALVCPERCRSSPLASLEAMSLVTEHAFHRFGLNRVWAGQAYPGLSTWTQRLELLGYKAEGFARGEFRHGDTVADSVKIALTRVNYLELIGRRGASLWLGEERMLQLIKKLRAEPLFADRLSSLINQAQIERDIFLEAIEK